MLEMVNEKSKNIKILYFVLSTAKWKACLDVHKHIY